MRGFRPPSTYFRLAGTAPPALIHSFDWLVSFALITLLFASIFRFLPAVRLKWRDVAAGALVTSILFTAGKFFLGVYLTEAGFAEKYGAAGSLVVLLVWVYYSAQVVFLGAEFTRVYAMRFGSLAIGKTLTVMIKPQRLAVSSSVRTAGILIGVIFVLYAAREIFVPLAFAITLALILSPAVACCRRSGWREPWQSRWS